MCANATLHQMRGKDGKFCVVPYRDLKLHRIYDVWVALANQSPLSQFRRVGDMQTSAEITVDRAIRKRNLSERSPLSRAVE